MNDKIFRKKSVDKMSSPEQLNDYIKVTNPGVWMVLAAIAVLLAGVCVWGKYYYVYYVVDDGETTEKAYDASELTLVGVEGIDPEICKSIR